MAILDAALKFSRVHIEPIPKAMQFIKGLLDKDEKRYLLEQDPETLADVYQWVVRPNFLQKGSPPKAAGCQQVQEGAVGRREGTVAKRNTSL